MRSSVLTPTVTADHVSLATLFWLFLKIGSVAFGGFMALISVIADTVVEKRKLLTQEDMLDCISLANLLPGPQGVNCVAYVGYRLRGALGAVVSAVGVLLPTFVLIVALTGLYVAYASKAVMLSTLFAGFIPAVAAVMVSVVHRMAKNVLKGHREVVLTLLAALALLAAPRAIRLYATLSLVCSFGVTGYALFRSPNVHPSVGQHICPGSASSEPWPYWASLSWPFWCSRPWPRELGAACLDLEWIELAALWGWIRVYPNDSGHRCHALRLAHDATVP